MAKTVSEDLFHLIKSLSKSEKRYFKLYAGSLGGQKDAIYVQLFDAIEKQYEYNENAIIKEIKNINPRQISNQKNYLYKLILKSLNIFVLQASVHEEIKEKIRFVERLFEKGLNKQANKMLANLSELAKNADDHLALMEIAKLYYQSASFTYGFSDEVLKKIAFIHKLEKKHIEIYENSINYFYHQRLAWIYTNRFIGGDKKIKEKFKSIIKHPLFSSDRRAVSFKAKRSFYTVHYNYCIQEKQYFKALMFAERLIALYELDSKFIKNNYEGYLNALAFYTAVNQHLNRIEDMGRSIEKMKLLKPINDRMRITLFYYINGYRLGALQKQGNFWEGAKLIHTIQKSPEFLKLNKAQLSDMYALFVLFSFATEKYIACKKYLYVFLNAMESRTIIISYAKVFSIILYYELNDIQLLEYAIRSTYRHLRKLKSLYPHEKIILNFIHTTMFKVQSERQLKSKYRLLRNGLVKVKTSNSEPSLLDFFDVVAWLDSKIENKTFAQVVQEKANRLMK